MADGFDLAAYRAANAEATHETFDVTLGDGGVDDQGNVHKDVLHFPPLRQWPIEAQERLGQGQIVEGMKLLVGDAEAELFKQYHWTFGEFEACFEALSKWSGFQLDQTSARPPVQGLIRRQS